METTTTKPKRVSELLTSERVWTKKAAARNAQEEEVGYDETDACRWCLYGACYHVYGFNRETDKLISRVMNYLDETYDLKGENAIGAWNDRPERTFADVRSVINAPGL